MALSHVWSFGRRHTAMIPVVTARTEAERARGLMYRRSWPRGHGFLMRYPHPQIARIWMANTYLPLDIVFIRADGLVVEVIYNAAPNSRVTHASPEPVAYVLELPAGTAAAQGISVGTRVAVPDSNS